MASSYFNYVGNVAADANKPGTPIPGFGYSTNTAQNPQGAVGILGGAAPTGNFPTGSGVGTPIRTTSSTSTQDSAATAQARANAQAAAEYDQSIRNIQERLSIQDAQLNSGYSGIDASWQNALNQLLTGKTIANRNYDENTQSTKTDYVGGKNTIGSNAGNRLNSVQRLLGMRGASGSSAYDITAPGGIAREATLQRNDLGTAFGKNIKALDQSWNDYLYGYDTQVRGANTQRENQRAELARSIQGNKASLLETLAQLSGQKARAAGGNAVGASQPYLDQANSLLRNMATYTVKPVEYQAPTYKSPTLDKYLVDPGAAPTVQGQSQGNDYTSPYLSALLKQKQTNTGAV